ncbi:pyridoxamine 5'-phosphate oxidase family protein [Nonomuraea sp. NPDC000554]|uniref:pyridoxamine 5'-phosphate oxidase family protein n=1 Tax=Nonomuraea sp. NPDC000554 TaxID=3154259 RepID=UPI00331CD253
MTDLGRRIAHHRERLGLSIEQLADRAELSSGYVRFLEEQPGSPTSDTLSQLAGALETTVDELLGGSAEKPPGRGPAMAHPSVETLDTDRCLRLIAPGGIGRVAFTGPNGPTVLPVNYKLHEGAVVFRTAHGGPMDKDLRTGLEGVDIKIGFEVDSIDEARHEGWSVMIQGPAHHVSEEELPKVIECGVTPWAGGPRELYIRIVPHQITGHRVHGL